MAIRLGLEARLYYCTDGIGGTPTWTEICNVKNVTLTLEKGEADVTTRSNSGWRATKGTLKDGSIEFEMLWDPEDTAFSAIRAAYFANSAIGIAVMDGPVNTVGSQGLWADCDVTTFTRNEPLEDAMTVSVTLKPTYSGEPPIWKVIT